MNSKRTTGLCFDVSQIKNHIMYLEIFLFFVAIVAILIGITGAFFPEVYNPSVVRLWKLYYGDDNFRLMEKHHYNDGNPYIKDIWLFRFENKPQCDVFLYVKPNGKMESMIMRSPFKEVLVPGYYRILSNKMVKKLMHSVGNDKND